MNRPDYWLTKFSKLRVDRARGDPAPHKPLLLLVLCDLAEQAALPHGAIPLSPELAFRFYAYWKIVAGRRTQRPDVRLPFHFLSGDGIWSVTDERGEPSPDKKLTKLARPPSDLVAFLEDPANREKARHLLIAKYFRPSEQIALYEMIGLPDPYWDSASILEENLHQKRAAEVVQYIQQIDRLHGKELPRIHYQAVAALAGNAIGGSNRNFRQTFTGKSFGIRSLVEFLARRERKRLLGSLWYDISSVDYAEFVPDRRTDFYLWRVKKGSLVSRRFKRPQPWAELVTSANAKTKDSDLPYAAFPELLLPFTLVYPHRLTPALVRSWERLLR